MDYFLKVAFLFSLLVFLGIFTLKFVVAKDLNGIDVVKEDTVGISEVSAAISGSESSSLEEASVEAVIPSEKESEEELKESGSMEEKAVKTTAELNTYETYPGEMLILKIKNAKDGKAESSICKGINLYPTPNGGLSALIPIKYDKSPGDYTVTFKNNDYEETLKFKVLPKDFPKTDIEVENETAEQTIENQKANDEYSQKVQSLKWQNESSPLWEGKFKEPVEKYKLTSDFGEIRTVNGKESGRHGGMDFAAPSGTPVSAPANGKVLFADFIALTGNTVMIEHGMGLKTLYYHMDSIDVSAGDEVKTGDSIGKIGTTGFSTGPHLHFAAAVENIYVNPKSLFENDYRSYIDE